MLKDKLKLLRKDRKLKQQQISEILNVTQSAYGFYETGSREPKIDTLIKLADYYDVSIDYLVDRDKKTTPLSKEVKEVKDAMENVTKPEQEKMLNTLKSAFPEAFEKYPNGYKYPIGFTDVQSASAYLRQCEAQVFASDGKEPNDETLIMMANELYKQTNG